MSLLEDETVLRLVASQLRNVTLVKLFEAGLWSTMRRFASDNYFWYLRTQSLTSLPIKSEVRDWREVYMNLRSLDLRDISKLQLYGNLVKHRMGHVDTISVLLELGWKIDEDENAIGYLRHCCIAGNVPALKLLDERFSKMTYGVALSVLQEVIKYDRREMLVYLFEIYPKLVRSTRTWYTSQAVRCDKMEMLKLLLQYPIDKRVGYGAYESCIRRNSIEMIKFILEHNLVRKAGLDGVEPAVRWNRPEILLLLVGLGSRPEVALYYCARLNRLELAQAIVPLLPSSETRALALISSAFTLACSRGHIEVAKLIYSSIPELCPDAKKNYALRLAVRCRRIEVVQWLLTLDSVDPLDGKTCALKLSLYNPDILQIIVRDRRVGPYDLDLNELGIRVGHLPWHIVSRIDQVVETSKKYLGVKVDRKEVFSWIARPTNLYLSLLQMLIIKNPDTNDATDRSTDRSILAKVSNSPWLLAWFRGREDPEVKRAVRGIIFRREPVVHTSSAFTAYRALLLTVEYGVGIKELITGLTIEGANEEGLRHAITLVAAL